MTRSSRAEEAAPVVPLRGVPPHRHGERAWVGPLTVTVLSVVAAVQALRLWSWRPGIPLSLSGDAPQVLLQVQGILEHSWYGTNPSAGAPFGLNSSWFTTADALNFLCIQVIGIFSHSPATVAVVFFLAQFPLAALTAYWLARKLGLNRPAAVVVGVLFSTLPGHQEWFAHLWLSAYWMLPLAVWLVVEVARGTPLWPPAGALRSHGAPGRAVRRRAMALAAIVAAIGLSDVYYVAFTVILLAFALVLRLATGTRPRKLVPEVLTTAAVGLLCGATLFVATRGRASDLVTGALPAQRVIGESETYAGKLIELVLPWYEHRAEPLRFLTYAYGVAAPPSVERPALGVVALVGVVALLWAGLRSLAGGRRAMGLTGLLAALTLVCLAFYTRGGLGSLVALFVTPQIRTWSRFVVLIGLFGLLAIGIWLSRQGRRRGRRWAWPVAALVCLVGVLDQTSPRAAPDYSALRSEVAGLTGYARAVHGTVGDCPVFQLPVVAYPEETPPGTMGDYDHLLPIVLAPAGLTWSYGAIRGTARYDWQLALPVDRPNALLQDLADAGFCAVSVDRDGYVGWSDPTSTIQARLGAPIAMDDSQNLAAFTLADVPPDPTRRDAVLRPVVASAGGSLVDTSGAEPFQWTGPSTQVRVANLGKAPVRATVAFTLEGNGERIRTVRIRAVDQPEQTVTVSAQRSERITMEITAAPGTSTIDVTADGEATPVPGSAGHQLAALKLLDLRVDAGRAVNAASLQEFAASSPRSLR